MYKYCYVGIKKLYRRLTCVHQPSRYNSFKILLYSNLFQTYFNEHEVGRQKIFFMPVHWTKMPIFKEEAENLGMDYLCDTNLFCMIFILHSLAGGGGEVFASFHLLKRGLLQIIMEFIFKIYECVLAIFFLLMAAQFSESMTMTCTHSRHDHGLPIWTRCVCDGQQEAGRHGCPGICLGLLREPSWNISSQNRTLHKRIGILNRPITEFLHLPVELFANWIFLK